MNFSLIRYLWVLSLVIFINPWFIAEVAAAVVPIKQDLYVANFNFGSPVVNRFDGETSAYKGVFAKGAGLITAGGVVFGPNGNLFVSSQESGIKEFDGKTGAFIRNFGPTSHVNFRGIQFGADGNLYVSEGSVDSINRYNGVTGAFIDYFVKPGTGGLDFPQHLLFGPDGNLYVSGTFTNGVLRFDGNSGQYLGVAANLGHGQAGIAFGPDGYLYVADPIDDKILRFDGSNGTFIDMFADIGKDGYTVPLDILFGPSNDIFISTSTPDQRGNVLKYDATSGDLLGVFADNPAIHNPGFMTFGPVIPLPSALWLFLTGLLGFTAIRRV